MAELFKLPLFPLKTVLFPGMVLPLHIFEPRYREMIGECIHQNTPFGVVLIRSGKEVGESAIPFMVGTSAYVMHVDHLDDGRMNIQSVGYQRFKIRELHTDKAYLNGTVELFHVNQENHPDIPPLVSRIIPEFKRYLATLGTLTGTDFALNNIPADGMALAFLAAIILPLPNREKQQLLETEDLLTMLRLEEQWIRRENMFLTRMKIRPERDQNSAENPFSSN